VGAAPLSEEEMALGARLAVATTAQERGRLHAALAVCAGKALAYRRMNHHEEASAKAFAEDSEPLRKAYETYRAAIDAFGARKHEEGVALLLRAQPVIVAELGEDHPYAHQVTGTLLGRVSGPETLAMRFALRTWLLERSISLYGATHTKTAQCRGEHAYFLAALGRGPDAMDAFERAIDDLLNGPWPDQAAPLLTRLAQLARAAGDPQRTAPRERAILARAPHSAWTVREVFFRRDPSAARRFNAEALQRGAPEFPQLFAAAEAAIAGTASTPAADPPPDDESATAAFASAIHAFCIHTGGSRPEKDSPALPGEWVLAALERKDAELRGPVTPDEARCPCQDDDEEGPRERQERTLQQRAFETMLTGAR
jgi:hypothetical protein